MLAVVCVCVCVCGCGCGCVCGCVCDCVCAGSRSPLFVTFIVLTPLGSRFLCRRSVVRLDQLGFTLLNLGSFGDFFIGR